MQSDDLKNRWKKKLLVWMLAAAVTVPFAAQGIHTEAYAAEADGKEAVTEEVVSQLSELPDAQEPDAEVSAVSLIEAAEEADEMISDLEDTELAATISAKDNDSKSASASAAAEKALKAAAKKIKGAKITAKTKSVKLTIGDKSAQKVSLKKLKKSDLTWTSSNKKVAAVSKTGVITAKKNGTAVITITAKNTSAKASIKVKVLKPSVKFDCGTSGDADQDVKWKLPVTIKNAKSSDLIWTTSDKKVATVSKKGVVTGKNPGECTITATVKGTKIKADCQVTVHGYTEYEVKTTAYCNCSRCCGRWAGGPTKSGTMPKEGQTIAVDSSKIPLGSHVVMDGKTYIAEDTGSAIKGDRIDVYFASHKAALNYGVQYKTIKVYE